MDILHLVDRLEEFFNEARAIPFTHNVVVDEDRMAGPRDFKVLKYSKMSGQKPEIKTLRVLGNQRLTAGGNVKRAKPKKMISVKKRSQT